MEALKKYWSYIVGAFVLILGAFFYEKKRAENAESKNIAPDNSKEQAVVETKIQDLNTNLEEAKKQAEEEKAKEKSKEELLENLKKI